MYDNQQYPHGDLTEQIIGIAIKVHRELGPGFAEKIYQRAMYLEMKKERMNFEREKNLFIIYNSVNVGYVKVDFVVENLVLVELKAAPEILDIHRAQVWSYLKASRCKIGLIINFGKAKVEVKRIIN
jgi:GxxExxY protein